MIIFNIFDLLSLCHGVGTGFCVFLNVFVWVLCVFVWVFCVFVAILNVFCMGFECFFVPSHVSFDHLLSFINVMFYKLRIPRQSDEVKHFHNFRGAASHKKNQPRRARRSPRLDHGQKAEHRKARMRRSPRLDHSQEAEKAMSAFTWR